MSNRGLKVKAMDAALVAGMRIENVEEYCRELGVKPRTFYRHRARIEAEGEWRERSRRPRSSPGRVHPDLEAWICKLRSDLAPDNGADYIRDALGVVWATTSPEWTVPARSTINRVLARNGLLDRNPAKRPRSSYRRFAYARPRDCYQIDATEVTLLDGQVVVVFDVLDDCTRTLVACRAAPAETTDAAIAAITAAFGEHGVPGLVLSDNGSAFTSRLTHPGSGPSRFTRAVTDSGARLIHSTPYHPQTCGKVERHHQTLKKWLKTQPAPATLRALQRLLDRYRDHYNNHRAHSALKRATPAHAWATAPTLGGPATPPRQTDATVHRVRVSATGAISVAQGQRVGVGTAHRGQHLTVIRDRDHATVYNADGDPIGHAHLTPGASYTALIPTP